ncbi:MAG: sulfatase-like hydrolase/transferase [bacterium]|nr:sulfatase-like hydrolase/transferase [bacterium]
MKRSSTLLTMMCGALLALSCASAPERQAAGKPNVIVILSDDAGYADFGFTGCTQFATPNIDRLARDGVVCTQGYVTASTCTPSRMGLMSGRYQQRFGAECNVPTIPTPGYTEEDLGLDTGEHTFGEAMQANGYRTMAIGKWHLGELAKYHPNRRGFDEFYGFLGGSRSYWPIENASRGRQILSNEQPVNEQKEIQYLTDDFTDVALDFIDRQHERPFFLYLAYNAVHGPLHAKQEDIDQYQTITPEKRRLLAAMTRSMDSNIGRLLERLDMLKLTGNTLIFFVNDNGGPQGTTYSNHPLRGFKGTYWEGGIRVPFIASWPARLPRGARFNHPVSTLDLLPTAVAAAGGTVEPAWQLDGVNLLPYLSGEGGGPPHETLFWRFWRVSAVRRGPWKLLRVADDPLKQKRGFLLPLVLLNLENDPGETTNVAEENPEKTAELLRALEAWEEPLAQPRWHDGSDWKHWEAVSVENHRMN